MEQTTQSSTSLGHVLPKVGMLCAATAFVSATATVVAIKVSSSFLTANSPCAPRCRRRWPRAVAVRHTLLDMDAGSGCAHRPWDELDAHQRTLWLERSPSSATATVGTTVCAIDACHRIELCLCLVR